ncbi:MAG: hypothetical protein RLZZ455_1202 [Candidatus Parcubacteria bacterium]|jgi:hypothetical protein
MSAVAQAASGELHFSRRAFIAATPLSLAVLFKEPALRDTLGEVGCQIDIHRPRKEAYSEYDEYVRDFPRASEETYARIFSSLDIHPLSSSVNVRRFHNSDRLARVETTLSEDQLVFLEVSGVHDPEMSLRAVEVLANDRQYYLPIMQTELNKSAQMTLGVQKRGNIVVDIDATKFSRGITSENIGIQLLGVEGSPLALSLLRLLNTLYLREDNDSADSFLLNDFPLMARAYLRENPFLGTLMWEKWIRATSQDGGTPLCRAIETHGTPTDYEVVEIDTTTDDEGLLLEQVDQGVQHAIVPYQKYEDPVVVSDAVNLTLQIDKKNNMTKREITSSHAVALVPHILSRDDDQFYQYQLLAADVFGARERWREGNLSAEFISRLAAELGGRDLVSEAYAYRDVV